MSPVAQRDNTEEPTADILYSMGVIARIGQIQRGLGGVQLLLQGEQRATALQYSTADGYLSAVTVPAEEMTPQTENDPAFTALQKETRERAAELGERRGLPEEVFTRFSIRQSRAVLPISLPAISRLPFPRSRGCWKH